MIETTQHQLRQFHEFALAKLRNGGSEFSIDELFDQWRLDHPSPEEHEANCKAVAASIRDFDGGERGVPAEQFMKDFRSRNDVK